MIGDRTLVTLAVPDPEAAITRLSAGCDGRPILVPSSLGVVVVDASPEEAARYDALVADHQRNVDVVAAEQYVVDDETARRLHDSMMALSDYMTALAFGGVA